LHSEIPHPPGTMLFGASTHMEEKHPDHIGMHERILEDSEAIEKFFRVVSEIGEDVGENV
jgi:hypothetical protein